MSGIISGLTTAIFSRAPVVTIAIGVTSEPVPAVVGMAINGNRGPIAVFTPYVSASVLPLPASSAASLATSIDDPPPNPMTSPQLLAMSAAA